MTDTSAFLLIASAYAGGLLSFFSPCIFPVIPIYLSMLSINGEKSLKRTFLFILGLSITFLVLGLGLGSIANFLFNDTARIIAGIIIIALGLFQSELFNFEKLNSTKIIKQKLNKDSQWAPLVLGITFSIGWTPCVGPILASILLLSGTSGSLLISLAMMLGYMLGIATPFLLFTFASKHLLTKLNGLKKHLNTLKKAGGYLMIIMGLLLATNQINFLAGEGTQSTSSASPATKQVAKQELSIENIKLMDLNGNEVNLNKYKGKKLYIKLWASWCPQCLKSLPDTDAMTGAKNKGFEVITVVFPGQFREKPAAEFKQWFQHMNYQHLVVLYDNEGQLADMVNLRAFPTTVLVNEDGKIIRVLPGHLSQDMAEYVFQKN